MFKWLKNITKRQPTYEEYNRYAEMHMPTRPEEDTNAHAQNEAELKFNETNPIYDNRIKKAKKNVISRMSEDKKVDLLFKLHIDESLEEQFDNINREDEI